jgi:hypothetical protein
MAAADELLPVWLAFYPLGSAAVLDQEVRAALCHYADAKIWIMLLCVCSVHPDHE